MNNREINEPIQGIDPYKFIDRKLALLGMETNSIKAALGAMVGKQRHRNNIIDVAEILHPHDTLISL